MFKKQTIESCYELDVCKLAKLGVFSGRGGLLICGGKLEVNYHFDSSRNTFNIWFVVEGAVEHQKIRVIQRKSNLGLGSYYLFLCPATGQACFKLIKPISNNRFYHRTAFEGLRYYSELRGSWERVLDKTFGIEARAERLRHKLIHNRPKGQKRTYKGKPTKRYKELYKLENTPYNAAYWRVANNTLNALL